MEKTISELEVEADYSTQRIEVVIHHILECLSNVKGYVLKEGLKNTDEEIRFFKYQKTVILMDPTIVTQPTSEGVFIHLQRQVVLRHRINFEHLKT